VPVGTWVKDGSRLKELGASGIYVDKFRNSTYPVINFDGYVIAKCCEMFFVEMNEQSASNA